ncbi:MAG: hypothetical protein KGM99_13090, partial [Burkholderiales bacterium]|nr:hypothetical protein [Burkholderiales bacterium]
MIVSIAAKFTSLPKFRSIFGAFFFGNEKQFYTELTNYMAIQDKSGFDEQMLLNKSVQILNSGKRNSQVDVEVRPLSLTGVRGMETEASV